MVTRAGISKTWWAFTPKEAFNLDLNKFNLLLNCLISLRELDALNGITELPLLSTCYYITLEKFVPVCLCQLLGSPWQLVAALCLLSAPHSRFPNLDCFASLFQFDFATSQSVWREHTETHQPQLDTRTVCTLTNFEDVREMRWGLWLRD